MAEFRNTCSWCNRPEGNGVDLVSNQDGTAFICKKCLKQAAAKFKEADTVEVETVDHAKWKDLTPSKIHAHLDQYIIGQDRAKKIIYVNGIDGNVENQIRRQALVDVLHEHGLELQTEFHCDFGFYTAFLQINAYLDNGNELPDAIVCANDEMALGINSALNERGYTVPEDVLLTGFDMIKSGQHTFPILATVSRGWNHLGELAYDKLYYQIQNPDERFEEECHSYFVPSESCGCKASEEALKSRFAGVA